MRMIPQGMAMLLAIVLLSSNCKVKSMEVHFITETKGLKAEHATTPPLMERVYHPPGTSTEEVMRVYADGSLYFYGPADSVARQWGYLTKVKPEGVAQLTTVLEEACGIEEKGSPQGHDLGSETFRFHTAACDKEVVIYGIDYGKYAALQRVTLIVNGNLEPISFPAH